MRVVTGSCVCLQACVSACDVSAGTIIIKCVLVDTLCGRVCVSKLYMTSLQMEELQFTFQPMTTSGWHTPSLKSRPLTSVPYLKGHTFPHLASFLPSFLPLFLSSYLPLPCCPTVSRIPRTPPFFCNPAQLVGEQDEHGPDVWEDEHGGTTLPSDLSPGSAEKQSQKLASCVSPWEVLTMWLKSWHCCFREQSQFKLDKDGEFLKETLILHLMFQRKGVEFLN